jgi:hypothetical protein
MQHRKLNPSNSPFACSKTYSLKKGLSIRFSFDAASKQISCDWSTEVPMGKKLREIWPAYLAARDDFFTGLDVSVLVLDL